MTSARSWEAWLGPARFAALGESLGRLREIPYCPHTPTIPQLAFLALDELGVKEALYGGAAGGGKSDALLMAALRYVRHPGYAALILRKTYADLNLPGAIMDRAKSWLIGQPGVQWHEQAKTFRFGSGASITFGYLENANDHYRYQGSEFQFIAPDELTQFREEPYQYLFSRLRKLAGVDIPLRMRAASNPGGVGHNWVKARFLDNPGDRVFIPARLSDNPHLDQEEYRRSLAALGEVERQRLEEGNWTVKREGLVYPDLDSCLIEPGHPIPEGTRYGGIDWGWHNPAAFLAATLDHDGVLWVDWELYGSEMPREVYAAKLPRDVARWFADPAGAQQINELKRDGFPVGGSPRRGKDSLQSGIALVNDWIRRGRLKVSRRCRNLINEAGVHHYDKDTEKPLDQDNHALAALRYLIVGLANRPSGRIELV